MLKTLQLATALIGLSQLSAIKGEETSVEVVTSTKYDAVNSPEEAGKQFLEDMEKRSDVIKLDSGLMYRVLTKGRGKVHPLPSTSCDCHYSGTLVNGDKFDSSYDRGQPTTFAPNQVIAGWTEAMQLMVEGDKWEMFIPYNLAYGEHGSPPKIPGKSALVFTMEIVAVKGEGKPALVCDPSSEESIKESGCDEKEKKYIEKQKGKKSMEEQRKEYSRLKDMFEKNKKTKNLTKKQRQWLEARMAIMEKMTTKKEEL